MKAREELAETLQDGYCAFDGRGVDDIALAQAGCQSDRLFRRSVA